MTGQDEREVLARAQRLIDNLVNNADDFTRSDLLDALGSLSVTFDSLIESATPTAEVKADVLEEAAREVRPKGPTFDISDRSYEAIRVNALHDAADRLEAIAAHLRAPKDSTSEGA